MEWTQHGEKRAVWRCTSRLETTRKVLAKGEEEIERFVELHRQLLSVIERRQVDEIAATVQDHYIFWKK